MKIFKFYVNFLANEYSIEYPVSEVHLISSMKIPSNCEGKLDLDSPPTLQCGEKGGGLNR